MKAIRIIILSIALASGFEAVAQFNSGNHIVIDEKVDHDLYLAGGNIFINAPVYGDLIVAGGTVTVNDTITNDVNVAGGNVILNHYVGDDIRAAGGNIQIKGGVAGDLVVTGGDIRIDEKVLINGSLYAYGGEVLMNGAVAGIIKSASGTFRLNGSAGSDIDLKGDKIFMNGTAKGNAILAANTIELGENARFYQDVRYWNKAGTLDFKESLPDGHAVFDAGLEIGGERWYFLGFVSFLFVIWYLGTALVMILLIQFLFSATMRNAARTVKDTSVRSLGFGVLFLIGIPVTIFFLVISIIGLPLGILLLISYVTILLLATVIVAILIANWINNVYYQSSWKFGKLVLAAFGIFIVLKLASLTPFVGPLIMFLLICMALGGILQNLKWFRSKKIELA